MKAAWYEQQGSARDVLTVGKMDDPLPDPGEVRIRMVVSGVNPGDVKKRQDTFGIDMPYPRVIPHSDGAGVVDQVGEGVSPEWMSRRVWCYGAQSYRPFGTAAEFTTVPVDQAVQLADSVPFERAASLGIPGITGHRAVHVAGPVRGRTLLVQGGAGAVGACAIQFAHRAGAHVIATTRSSTQQEVARRAGADEVLLAGDDLIQRVRKIVPDGVDHIVEVAFGANITADIEMLSVEGSIATYASDVSTPELPFWPLVFINARVFFLGSDDFPLEAKVRAAGDISHALESGWEGLDIVEQVPLADIARAHELVEHPTKQGRVVVTI